MKPGCKDTALTKTHNILPDGKTRWGRALVLVNQGLAMRLGPFDETHLPDLQINLEPRVKYDLPNQARAEMNLCPPLG